MRKFSATIVSSIIVIQFVIPITLTNYLREKIYDTTGAQNVTLTLDSFPSAKIILGYVDELQCTANDLTIGELKINKLELNGKNLNLNFAELLKSFSDTNREEHINNCVRSADNIDLSGVITEENLVNFLEAKVKHIHHPKITMTSEGVNISGEVKIFGKKVDAQINGNIIVRDGDLYFQTKDVEVENMSLKRVNLNKFLGDFNLTNKLKMPFGLQFNTIEMRDGEAIVKLTNK